MSKMLFQLELPPAIAKAKEDLGVGNIWKYLRYYRMFIERFSLKHKGVDLSHATYDCLLWNGVVALYYDKVSEMIIPCRISNGKKNPIGEYYEVDIEGENNYVKRNLKVNKDVVLMYADGTRIPPIIYIWAIANEVISREDIIRTQDNMLRKPILVDGVGEQFDNAVVKASNVLSGVAWMNRKGKGKNKDNIMSDSPLEVLNLQVGNSYKGKELWDSRKNLETLICDYLGYTTVKNEKAERMNQAEVEHENSIGQTFYESALELQKLAIKQVKEFLGEELEFTKLLKPVEVKNNVSDEKEVE